MWYHIMWLNSNSGHRILRLNYWLFWEMQQTIYYNFKLKSNIILNLTTDFSNFHSVNKSLPIPGILGWGPKNFFFVVTNEFNCIKIYNKAIFLLQWFLASELYFSLIWGIFIYRQLYSQFRHSDRNA
jgi:hypothetical protein